MRDWPEFEGVVADLKGSGGPSEVGMIEVTPEMTEAGMAVLLQHLFRDENWHIAVPKIYCAMAGKLVIYRACSLAK